MGVVVVKDSRKPASGCQGVNKKGKEVEKKYKATGLDRLIESHKTIKRRGRDHQRDGNGEKMFDSVA
jgi:hypothetical protein